ncbi:hypothetical protein RhiirA4_468489 [Rhizophagus irregularis]|uniref:Uncharacterized protein n=1 Tax=Rhizophagus irregularis TaxID=588596 RepID=A0A2I1GXT3_9GLOM|nr:hypothetical protein RhiirA4_468489 [Rhizophagus irregularis]
MVDSDLISSINFQFIDRYQNLEENYLNHIIKLQKNLKNISFNFDSLPLYNSLNNPNNPNQSINLSIVRLFNIKENDEDASQINENLFLCLKETN